MPTTAHVAEKTGQRSGSLSPPVTLQTLAERIRQCIEPRLGGLIVMREQSLRSQDTRPLEPTQTDQEPLT